MDVSIINKTVEDKLISNKASSRKRKHYLLHRSGKDAAEIASLTGWDIETVTGDIEGVRVNGGFDADILGKGRVALFLEAWADLEASKAAAWEAWEKSTSPQVTVKTKRGGVGEGTYWEKTKETRSQTGDPRYLAAAADALHRQLVLAGLVSDGQGGRAPVHAADELDGDDDTVAIVEVGDREQAASVAGKRFCRLGVVEGQVVGSESSDGESSDEGEVVDEGV
jgi:hypothetical protein